jgi:phosphatidylserine decarboxylase
MGIHKEGYWIIIISFLILGGADTGLFFLLGQLWFVFYPLMAASLIFFILIVRFFRVPNRVPVVEDGKIICPADGKVVVIEEVDEPEYFKDKRIQVSIFMSPLNVHIQWFPMGGIVKYFKYHPGLYLVAWHPKSSTDNERTSIVVEDQKGRTILFKQIAGAVARRICWYCKEGDEAKQGEDFGFIKFGSRVDILLPLDAKIKVELDQVVTGSQTVLAEFAE